VPLAHGARPDNELAHIHTHTRPPSRSSTRKSRALHTFCGSGFATFSIVTSMGCLASSAAPAESARDVGAEGGSCRHAAAEAASAVRPRPGAALAA